QRHAVLAYRYGRLRGTVVLGGRKRPGSSTRVRPASSRGLAPGRLHHVPRRDLADTAELGRALLPERHVLQRGRQGRPLRSLGRTGALRERDSLRVSVASLDLNRTSSETDEPETRPIRAPGPAADAVAAAVVLQADGRSRELPRRGRRVAGALGLQRDRAIILARCGRMQHAVPTTRIPHGTRARTPFRPR